MNIKELFDNAEGGTLTFEQFEAAAKAAEAKFADLSEGKYVSKSKYDSDIRAKDAQLESVNAQVEALNGTIATRDTDLASLQQQLAAAGEDASKIAELTSQISGLQTKYDADVQNYQAQMRQQEYEFAVREFAGTQRFTSQAAKRDFVQTMIARGLQMEGGKILGRDDFLESYAQENAEAFVVDAPEPEPQPAPAAPIVPEFVAPTPGAEANAGNESAFNFNFQGVRAHD